MFEQLFDFLDLVLACSEQGKSYRRAFLIARGLIPCLGYLDGAAPLTVVEEMLDVHPIDGCERIFEYIEKRKARLTAVSLFAFVFNEMNSLLTRCLIKRACCRGAARRLFCCECVMRCYAGSRKKRIRFFADAC